MHEPQGDRSRTSELREYLTETASRIQALQTEVSSLRRPYRMEPLSESACAGLVVQLASHPQQAHAAEQFLVRVELQNGSFEKIGSFPPCPLHFSYRWLAVESDRFQVVEGMRTLVRPSLRPTEHADYDLKVVAPEIPGRYRLRVTLVQETVGWLDQLAKPVFAETQISVI
jgi:hypothetical protein